MKICLSEIWYLKSKLKEERNKVKELIRNFLVAQKEIEELENEITALKQKIQDMNKAYKLIKEMFDTSYIPKSQI